MPLSLIFTQPGNYTIDDNGVPGDNISVIRDGNGTVIFTFGHPADALTFTVSTPGVNITVNFTDTLGAADFTIGSLTDAAATPDSVVLKKVATTGTVTVVSNGSITEGGADPDADITAGAVILSAATGVGTAGNALEIRTSLLEAETTTGGINLGNVGSVQVGGLNDQVNGLDVLTSGDLSFTTLGSIFLSELDVDALESVHGGGTSGNVTLNANGYNADIIGNTDLGAITAPRGSIALNAGRDVQLGTIGSDFNNDVIASGGITISAGRDFILDGFADVLSDNFGLNTGGNIVVNAGRNISVLAVAGTSASLVASGSGGADVILTTGSGGTLTVSGPGSFALGSTSGNVTANADRTLIAGTSGISAPSGQVTLRTATAGRAIILGSASDAALALELSDAELDRIFAPTLVIGGSSAGAVTVISGVGPANVQDLTVQSGSDITLNAGTFLSVADDLTLRAGDDIRLVAGAGLTYGGTFSGHVDVGGTDPGEGGTAYVDPALSAAVRFFGGNDSDTLYGGANNDWLDGAAGADTLRGRTGDDIYTVDNASDVTAEGAGEGSDTVRTALDWTLASNVEILTQLGSSSIDGTGNVQANTLNGNNGANTLAGLAGQDTLLGNGGSDTLQGGDGDDTLNGGGGNDVLNGGNHIDTVTYAGGGAVTVSLSIAGAQATGGSGSDTLGNVENLTGSNGNDTLTGNAAVNVLAGGTGNDTLNGLAGNDTLLGDAGTDTLVGGNGRDIMTGGANADTFDFNDIGETGTTAGTRDQIEDFAQGADRINLATIDASTLTGGNQAFAFIGAAAFSGVAGQLRATTTATTTLIQGDINGNGTADFQIQLNTVVILAAGDFVL